MLPSDYLTKGWCQNTASKDEHGNAVINRSPTATKWCIQSSANLSVSNGYITDEHYRQILAYLKNKVFDITGWNDHPDRTQIEVIKLMKSAEKSLGLHDEYLDNDSFFEKYLVSLT